MKSKFSEALNLFQNGKPNKAKNICEEILKQEANNSQVYNLYAFTLHYLEKFDAAVEYWSKAIKINPNYIEAYNGRGDAFIKLQKFDEAIINFNQAIKINPNYFEAYNNLGNAFIKLQKFDEAIINFNQAIKIKPNYAQAYYGKAYILMKSLKLDEAIINFNQAIKINPNYANAYNSMGSTLNQLGQWEEAINCYTKTLEINPNHKDAHENLINLLTFYNPKKNSSNSIIKTNYLLRSNKFNFDLKNKITDEEIINYYYKTYQILKENLHNDNFDSEQIYRRNTFDLNCDRHFEVFNTYNVIPKFCFGCYKILINPKNIIELFKLYIVFDNLKLEKNNIRKCIIELRPSTGGVYKGFIYCSGLNEAQKIFKDILPIIKTSIGDNLSISIKRGCSEFSVPYPKFKEIDQSMKYNDAWREKEKQIDEKNKNKNTEKVLGKTISGITISDALVMRNWLIYAKRINDESYKEFNINIPDTKYMENKFFGQLDHRKEEFQKII